MGSFNFIPSDIVYLWYHLSLSEKCISNFLLRCWFFALSKFFVSRLMFLNVALYLLLSRYHHHPCEMQPTNRRSFSRAGGGEDFQPVGSFTRENKIQRRRNFSFLKFNFEGIISRSTIFKSVFREFKFGRPFDNLRTRETKPQLIYGLHCGSIGFI